ncbi:HNH endonuclease [Beutenbergia cavernae DSM 12333]|uniref:HNH endonuclease n=1 Tax=Beutenbergia cavernae (strain ATCC BAA-8 / DSM 12333 / CCUG 43141 / JCM 11478 / NBRC 16432 / NCIMB 13614 / HKI 0122) TaxID=471853 RepID=C5C4D7_BEUC1|nr:HNH endonuclease signature motif containing protein [Beutenbergia cavernae]ACQ82061.1 HNH endonuclease [Beutenbergia cavernae DSM 12333]
MFETRADVTAAVSDGLQPEPVGVEEFAALASLDALPEHDGGSLSDAQVLDVVAGWAAVEARAAGAKRAWAAALARRPSQTPDWRELRRRVSVPSVAGDEIAVRVGVSRMAAARWIAEGELLAGKLGNVGVALQAGVIDAGKAREFVDALAEQDLPVVLAVCDEVLPEAPTLSQRQVATAIQRAVVRVDPQGASERHERAARRRCVERVRVLPDGMARLSAVLTAAQAAGVYAACEAAARAKRAAGDSRTLEQLRADALAALGAEALAQGRIGPEGSVEHRGAPTSPEAGDAAGRRAPGPGADEDVPASGLGAGEAVRESGPRAGDALGASGPRAGKSERESTTSREPKHPPRSESPEVESFRFSGPAARLELSVSVATLSGQDWVGTAHDVAEDLWPSRLPDDAGEVAGGKDGAAAGALGGAQDEPAPPEPVPLLTGYGAVDPATARALAAEGLVRVVVTDAELEAWRRATAVPGAATEWDAGRETYHPPAALARLVRARDGTCVAPGCSVPATSCDLDHVVSFPLGPTDAWNLRPLCRRHHLLKTRAGHRLSVEADGSTSWTTPSGVVRRRAIDGTWARRDAPAGANLRRERQEAPGAGPRREREDPNEGTQSPRAAAA